MEQLWDIGLFIVNLGTYFMIFVGIICSLGLVYLYFTNVLEVLYRLGKGLAKRDIAVFAEDGNFTSLQAMLADSKIFKAKKIHQIHKDSLDKAQSYTIFLVYWDNYSDDKAKFLHILSLKDDKTALIVYADKKRIDDDIMNAINEKRNAIVVNLRGRLINDIVVSLITTSYFK